MSDTKTQIISNMINNPENAADAFIKLQKEFTQSEQALKTCRNDALDVAVEIAKDSEHLDECISRINNLKAIKKLKENKP